jgi:predicted amidophosphoribosyltransferase
MGSTYKYPQFLAVVWNDKGFAFFQLNNYQEAIKCYLKALEINPNFIKALNNKKNAENALIELKNIICPQCGSKNPQESEYCINCGRQLKIKMDSKKCSNCGFENLEVAEFCIECGKKFISTENNLSCPKCNTQINSETKFCPECGNKIEQINNNKICPKCNSTIDKDVKFCPECGENLKISRA